MEKQLTPYEREQQLKKAVERFIKAVEKIGGELISADVRRGGAFFHFADNEWEEVFLSV